MSKNQVKTQIDTDITNKTTVKSISPLNVGSNMKAVVDLISDTKTNGSVLAINGSKATLQYDINTVNKDGGSEVKLPTTTEVGKEVLFLASNYAGTVSVYVNDAEDIKLSGGTNGISGNQQSLQINANEAYRFIYLTNNYWYFEKIIDIPTNLYQVTSDRSIDLTINPTSNFNYPSVKAVNDGLLLKANDADVVHRTGNQIIAGIKEYTNTISAIGINIDNGGSNNGINITNNLASTGINITSDATGKALVLNNSTGATGIPFTIQDNSVDKLTINGLGEVTGTKFIKSGATSTDALLAGGTTLSSPETQTNKSLSILTDYLSDIKYPSVKSVYDWVTTEVVGAPLLGAIVPTDTPTGAGEAFWFATTAGTYTNFGGGIVGSNEFAVFVRSSGGTFTMSKTSLDLTGYLQITDIVNSLDSSEIIKPLSALQGKITDKKIKQTEGVNLFDKNDLIEDVVLRPDNAVEAGYLGWATTKLIKISPNTNYYLSNYAAYGIYNYELDELSYVDPFALTSGTFTTGSTAYYIRITRNDSYPLTQLNIGSTLVAYSEFVTPMYDKDEQGKEVFFNPSMTVIDNRIFEQFQQTEGLNLFDKDDLIPDVVLRPNNILEAGFIEWSTTKLIKIKPNTAYYFSNYYVYGIYDKELNELAYIDPFSLTSGTFTTPQTALYLRASIRKIGLDIVQLELGTSTTAYTPFVSALYDKGLNDVEIFFNPAPEKVKELVMGSYLYNKDWLALGDSITFRDEYTGYVSTSLGLNSFTNKGVSGRQVYQMIYEKDVDGLGTLDLISPTTLNEHDIISFCGYANNYGGSTVIGSISDAIGGTSFYSQVKTVIEYLCTNAPDKLIIGIGALQMKGYFAGDFGTVNGVGASTFDYNEAMRLTCEMYGIPFVDLYRNGGVNKLNADTYYTSPDYVHPNNTNGMQKMGRLIASKFKQLSEKID